MTNEMINYFKNNYDNNIILEDFEDKNYCFDIIARNKNINTIIEYKCRYFESGKNDKFLKEYDILIELIQSLPYFFKKENINNYNINDYFNSYKINISLGWFYKVIADRLIFFRFLDNNIYDIIDIDFKLFKPWFMNNVNDFKLQYSNKTTCTINSIVYIKDIPKILYRYLKY